MNLFKKRHAVIIGILASVFAASTLLIFQSKAFVGPPPGVSPGIGGGVLQFGGNSISVGSSTIVSTTTFSIFGSSTDANSFSFAVNDSAGVPIFRVRNDGIIISGDLADSEIVSGGNNSLQAKGVRARYVNVDELSTVYATVDLNIDGGGDATISNFASISAGNFDGQVGAETITPGIFKAGNYAFPGRLGANTSTLPTSYELTVDGDTYITGNVGIGALPPSSGPGALNIKPDPSLNDWQGGIWSKAIRIEGNGAIEFGGGTGGVLYGIGAKNNKLYIFDANAETGATISYNLVMGANGIAIGNVSESTDPQAALEIKLPAGGPNINGILVGRANSSVSSIRALGGGAENNDLVINSTSSGKLYLNDLTGGNVILGTGGGTVGIGTNSPDATAKLDVAGTAKIQTIQITGGSPAAGQVLTATDSSGNAAWQDSGIPSGSAGNTLYHNGTAWVATSNLYNDGTSVGIGTANPLGTNTLNVTGGIAVGTSYAGSVAPPSGGVIISGSLGIGTASPGAKLEVSHGDDSKGLRLRDLTNYVDFFAAVGDANVRNGEALCRTKIDAAGALCLGYWDSSGTSVGCGSYISNGRALCADAD